jgi:hypothetical protein
VKGFRLLVNRSATWATWVDELVALELSDLDALDFDLSLPGFDPFEIDEFLFPDAIEASAKVPNLPKVLGSRPEQTLSWLLTSWSHANRRLREHLSESTAGGCV